MGKVLTILAHGDSDGVAAASLVLAALRSRYDRVNVRFTHPVGLAGDFREFAEGDVVIVDIAISESHFRELDEAFSRYPHRILYIDHHPPPVRFNHLSLNAEFITPHPSEDVSASELTFREFRDLLDRDFDRVALYGAIADYADQTPWVKEVLERWDKRQIYFEAGILVQGLEGSRGMYDFKRHVVEHLSRNRRPSQLSELLVRALIQAVNNEELHAWVKRNVRMYDCVAYVINPPGSIGVAAAYARGVTGACVGIAAEERGGVYVMSLRGDGRIVDLNKLLRKVTPALGGSGGGHPGAAGARIPRNSFNSLLEEISREVKHSTQLILRKG